MQPRPTQLELRNLQIAKIKTLYVNRLLPVTPHVIEIGTNGVNVVGPIYVNGGALPIPSINTPDNFALGISALSSLTTGFNNVAVGPSTLTKITTNARNTAIGVSALQNTTGGSNTAIGVNAMKFAASGNANIAIGDDALLSNVGSSYFSNIAIGSTAFTMCDTGSRNIAIGVYTLGNVTTATNNVTIGSECGYGIIDGNYNTAIGSDAFFIPAVNSHCTVVGYGVARNQATGDSNVIIGSDSLTLNVSSVECVTIGRLAMFVATTASSCTAIGYRALANCDANFNTGVGTSALLSLTTGTSNTALGSNTDVNSDAVECVAIGAYAQANSNYSVQCGQRAAQASGALYYRLQRVCDATWNDVFRGLMTVGGDGAFAKSRALTPGFERFTLTGNSVQNPNIATASTFITTNASVAGATPVGTLVNGTTDGQIKNLTLSAQSGGINYILTVTNGIKTNGAAITTITFNSAGQTAELIWDNSAGKWYVLKATALFA